MLKKIPWWLKIFVKIVFSRLPIKYSVWKSLGLFQHGKMDHSNYSLRVFKEHLNKSKIKSLKNKVVLEVGPGDSIASSIISYSYGASSVLIDSGNFVQTEISTYLKLKDALILKGLDPPKITKEDNIAEILNKCNSKYFTEGLKSLKKIPSNSVDFIFSQAVWEHIRLKDFEPMNAELYRVLKKDGMISHQVDLRDHLGGSLNNLRFSDRLWESNLFAKSGFYTNRINFDKMISVFESLNFKCEILNIQKWNFLPLKKSKMNKKFRELSEENLRIKVFDIILKK